MKHERTTSESADKYLKMRPDKREEWYSDTYTPLTPDEKRKLRKIATRLMATILLSSIVLFLSETEQYFPSIVHDVPRIEHSVVDKSSQMISRVPFANIKHGISQFYWDREK